MIQIHYPAYCSKNTVSIMFTHKKITQLGHTSGINGLQPPAQSCLITFGCTEPQVYSHKSYSTTSVRWNIVLNEHLTSVGTIITHLTWGSASSIIGTMSRTRPQPRTAVSLSSTRSDFIWTREDRKKRTRVNSALAEHLHGGLINNTNRSTRIYTGE